METLQPRIENAGIDYAGTFMQLGQVARGTDGGEGGPHFHCSWKDPDCIKLLTSLSTLIREV